jgi:spore coat polysaccharide biosynthesis protein SpsF
MIHTNIVTVIQARTGSSRLPNKVMLSLCGKPLLLRMVERVMKAKLSGTVVIATSTNGEDDSIEELCYKEKLNCFRGHPTDLLDRHYFAAKKFHADAVAKIPSDCPLIDPKIIDLVYKYFLDHYFDFVSNLHPPSFPDGNDVEIMSFNTLETAWKESSKDFEREHTTPFIWEHPERFKIGNIKWKTGLDFSSTHRWTIDYEEDYIFIRTVFEELYFKNSNFDMFEILNLLEKKSFIADINSKFAGKYWYDNHLNELNHIDEYKNKHKIK